MKKGSHRFAFVQDDNARVNSAAGGRGYRGIDRTGGIGSKGGEIVGDYGNEHGVGYSVGDCRGRGEGNRGAGGEG